MMRMLLQIQDQLFLDTKSLLNNSEELCATVADTIWAVWIRSHYTHDEMWIELEQTIQKHYHQKAITKTWSALLTNVTYILGENTFGVLPSSLKDHSRRKKAMKTREQSMPDLDARPKDSDFGRPREANENARQSLSTKPGNKENDGSAQNFGSDEALDQIAHHSLKNSIEAFANPQEFQLGERSMFVWKNLVCCIGRIDHIKDPATHYVVLNAVIQSWDILDKIRAAQPYSHTDIPSILDVAGIIFKATQMGTEYERSVAMACGAICRIMCKKYDQQVPLAWNTLFYKTVIKHLNESSDTVSFSIIGNATKLYTLCLPGVTQTIPAMMKCCSTFSLMGEFT